MGRPTGVTVLAILDFIGAAFCVLLGIGMIAGGGMLATIIGQQGTQGSGGAAAMIAGMGAVASVGFFIGAAISALLGWGLWKLKEWARIITIILVGINAAFGLLGLLGTLAHFNLGSFLFTVIFLAIYAWIIMYLLKPEVKAAFQGAQARAVSA